MSSSRVPAAFLEDGAVTENSRHDWNGQAMCCESARLATALRQVRVVNNEALNKYPTDCGLSQHDIVPMVSL